MADPSRPNVRMLCYRCSAAGLQFMVAPLMEYEQQKAEGWKFLGVDPEDEEDLTRWVQWRRAEGSK